MTYAIAAAGTGGHVYPGLAVGEALVDMGIPVGEVLFVGGDRLEATVYPEAGFPFLGVETRGLSRQMSFANLALPLVVARAVKRLRIEFRRRRVAAVLGLGGYVTVPSGLAARWAGASLALAEQNAEAGLANRVMAPFSSRVFGSFPTTEGLGAAEWVGNPLRRSFMDFDRSRLRPVARERWGLDPELPTLGVFGGSLGAGAINQAVTAMVPNWENEPIQVLHLAGRGFEEVEPAARVSGRPWVVLDFCDEMNLFYAACDLVVARAGGSVAELTATSTPSVLVPGGFGSGGHQRANAAVLAQAGAAVVVDEDDLDDLDGVVASLLHQPGRLQAMADATRRLARPDAAAVVAGALVELAAS